MLHAHESTAVTHSNFAVRFPDGVIKYGIRDGGYGDPYVFLFGHPDSAWGWWHTLSPENPYRPYFLPSEVEDVEVCDRFGRVHMATATKSGLRSVLTEDEMDVARGAERTNPSSPEWARLAWSR